MPLRGIRGQLRVLAAGAELGSCCTTPVAALKVATVALHTIHSGLSSTQCPCRVACHTPLHGLT